tara:strand:- start:2245 stop:2667 length:423 start_codon:yes stop_codon:yes gene_type:complete
MIWDYNFYKKTNPDIIQYLYSYNSALNHYNIIGKYEGRLPNKDALHLEYYLDKYKDLPMNNIKSLNEALDHYLKWGRLEGRSFKKESTEEYPDNFNHKEYLNKHLEILNTTAKIDRNYALKHYLNKKSKNEKQRQKVNLE